MYQYQSQPIIKIQSRTKSNTLILAIRYNLLVPTTWSKTVNMHDLSNYEIKRSTQQQLPS